MGGESVVNIEVHPDASPTSRGPQPQQVVLTRGRWRAAPQAARWPGTRPRASQAESPTGIFSAAPHLFDPLQARVPARHRRGWWQRRAERRCGGHRGCMQMFLFAHLASRPPPPTQIIGAQAGCCLPTSGQLRSKSPGFGADSGCHGADAGRNRSSSGHACTKSPGSQTLLVSRQDPPSNSRRAKRIGARLALERLGVLFETPFCFLFWQSFRNPRHIPGIDQTRPCRNRPNFTRPKLART